MSDNSFAKTFWNRPPCLSTFSSCQCASAAAQCFAKIWLRGVQHNLLAKPCPADPKLLKVLAKHLASFAAWQGNDLLERTAIVNSIETGDLLIHSPPLEVLNIQFNTVIKLLCASGTRGNGIRGLAVCLTRGTLKLSSLLQGLYLYRSTTVPDDPKKTAVEG